MAIRDQSRRDLMAAGVLAGAAMLAGPVRAQGAPAAGATRGAVLPPRDPTPFTVPQFPPPALTAPARVAKLKGVDLWYWDTGGAGPVVVLQHAMSGSGHVWGYQQQTFQRAGFRVIGYSRRGYRASSLIAPDTTATAVDDMQQLMDHLKVDRCHVVGTAGGGLLAGGWALHHPKRAITITIACSVLTLTAPEILALFPSRGVPRQPTIPVDLAELSPSYRSLARDGHKLWNELHEAARPEKGLPAQPYGGPATMEEIARIGAVPTLLIYGDADWGCPPPVGRAFNRAIPNSELAVFTECGHSAYWERPDLFNAAVLDFIKRRAV